MLGATFKVSLSASSRVPAYLKASPVERILCQAERRYGVASPVRANA